jgi:hypothetical protein
MRFSTGCPGYECDAIIPTETSYYPCMRHCQMVVLDDRNEGCGTNCHDHGVSFEGVNVVV